MEQDRFSHNQKLYILGMICLLLGLGLFVFSLYIIPFFIWDLNYNVPYFILALLNLFQEEYNYSIEASKVIVWLIFFIPGIVTGLISYVVSNYIDNQIYKAEQKSEENQGNLYNQEKRIVRQESIFFSLKILGLMILFVFLIFLFQYLIQS
ncbi:hypothetical protein [Legionella longbeachae]|uniref:Putative transmembrane protein n=1 Tax=Legionella longbeachae serogroup 1 (strain NSW150) TaxID=661367 RepID=D3HSN9_LEGLN|nr:hypothetical protein [Legionella longbeachae]VEE02423.1 transmembrane protein [Legionella oakridgensis]HBD7398087.1 hypothetical protein [Legionella pneumophila]ARB91298.1 hypothetical protein A6J40_03440 [Legionella longbeachae]ARM32278.1 hypothetical protein B0B39_01440 [Legionella longbeachae]EEZ94936.1 conserved hypothetical protein [Legionella longbeachae D-4968]